MKRTGIFLLILGTVFILSPIISIFAASLITGIFGCPLNEGVPTQCIIPNTLIDVGGFAYSLFTLSYFSPTLVGGTTIIGIILIILGIDRVKEKRGKKIKSPKIKLPKIR